VDLLSLVAKGLKATLSKVVELAKNPFQQNSSSFFFLMNKPENWKQQNVL
jgi:hypothetical protein